MEKEMNKFIINRILEYIPGNFNPVNYLADILGISNKSVYRRLKGEIPFTITEVMTLSKKLKFSIDNIFNQYDNESVCFPLQATLNNSPHESLMRMLQQYYDHTQALNKAVNVQSFVALNHLPMIFCTAFENLFKFFYYQWMHQNHNDSLRYRFGDATLPADINLLREKIAVSSLQNPNNTFIYDPNVYLSTIKEIQYYYRRNLITDDEIELIKKDLLGMVDHVKELLSKGRFEHGGHLNLYLLEFNLKVSSCYIIYDNTVVSNIMIYTVNPINIFNSKVFSDQHKRWFDNIKKYAVLITQSNEELQAQFLEKQRKYIEQLPHLI